MHAFIILLLICLSIYLFIFRGVVQLFATGCDFQQYLPCNNVISFRRYLPQLRRAIDEIAADSRERKLSSSIIGVSSDLMYDESQSITKLRSSNNNSSSTAAASMYAKDNRSMSLSVAQVVILSSTEECDGVQSISCTIKQCNLTKSILARLYTTSLNNVSRINIPAITYLLESINISHL